MDYFSKTVIIGGKRLSSDNEPNKTAFDDYFGAFEGSESRKSMKTLKERRTMCTEVYRGYIESLSLSGRGLFKRPSYMYFDVGYLS
jgi:hypothetical protein